MSFLSNLSIKRKLIYSYVIVALIPILIIGYYLTNKINNDMINQTKNFYEGSVRELNKNIVNRLYSYSDIIETIIYDKNLAYYLNMSIDDDISLYNEYINRVMPLISRAQYKENKSILKIYTKNEMLKFSGIFIRDINKYNSLLKTIKETDSNISWSGTVTEKGYQYVKLQTGINDYFYTNETLGILEILINLEIFNSLLNADTSSNNEIFLFDDKGNLLAANHYYSIDTSIAEDYREMLTSLNNNTLTEYNNKDYLFLKSEITNDKLKIKNWYLGYLVPLENIHENTMSIWMTSLLLSLICLLLSIIVTILISRNITIRIGLLVAKMHKVKKGDFNISKSIEGIDEIAQLDEDFKMMVSELTKLMNEIYDAKLMVKNSELKKQMAENAEKEARLLTLQSQINPHYLFNTMETIRMNLLIKGDKETAEIIKLFGESFRIMISETNEVVTLKEELDFMKKYFLIQKYRYEDKLNLIINIKDEILTYNIPKFIFQPLIENAIYHGLELKDGPGIVEVSVSIEKDYLLISVTDDGVGIASDRLKELLESINDDNKKDKNFALRNINKRIKLLYGTRAEFSIKSKLDIGTTVDIRLPLEG